mmetsp:Transcript_79626/g.165417  ORF Transcript_79626/g.165417 Transcript_79626/m.165417 type:complete len:117 (+) Transcript_79626:223-573(+)
MSGLLLREGGREGGMVRGGYRCRGSHRGGRERAATLLLIKMGAVDGSRERENQKESQSKVPPGLLPRPGGRPLKVKKDIKESDSQPGLGQSSGKTSEETQACGPWWQHLMMREGSD